MPMVNMDNISLPRYRILICNLNGKKSNMKKKDYKNGTTDYR